MASLALGGSGMASIGPDGVQLGPFWDVLRFVTRNMTVFCGSYFFAIQF